MSKAHRDQTRRAKITGARPTAAQRRDPREPEQQAAWDEVLAAMADLPKKKKPHRPTP